MTQETTDTKAAWKRRALRAEMTVALREARDILGSVTPGQGVPA